MIAIIAFVLGYALIGFSCYITMADVVEWLPLHYHFWAIAVVCYTIIFGTLLFSKFITTAVDDKIGSWVIEWPGRILLVAVLGVSAGLGFYVENIKICYLIDGIAVFVYLLVLCVSLRTTKHIQEVQKTESHNRIMIDEVRKASLSLNIVAQNLPDEFANQKKQILAIKEELRYLSPSSKSEALRIEESILKLLQELKNDCFAGREVLSQKIALLNACIAERKNIY